MNTKVRKEKRKINNRPPFPHHLPPGEGKKDTRKSR